MVVVSVIALRRKTAPRGPATPTRVAAGAVEEDDTAAPSSAPARLTVVIETVTRAEYHKRDEDVPQRASVLGALGPAASDPPLEVLIMVDQGADTTPIPSVDRTSVRTVEVEDPSYYAMKNAGFRAATTPYVAFLDGDCMPAPGWASRATAALDAGADVVAGKSRYVGPGAWARIMGYFDLGTVSTRADGTATAFHLNNVAFRREVLDDNPFDTRFQRSGGCVLANFQLRAKGRRIVYEPAMFVAHGNDYKKGFSLSKRFGSGHNTVNIRCFDDTNVVPYPWLPWLGPFGAPLIAGRRLWNDLFLLARQHDDLGIRAASVPLVWLIAVPMRILEAIGYAISSVKPSIIGKYWG